MSRYESIEVASLTPHIGAEVSGVDLAKPLSNAVWDYFPQSRYGERVSIVGERPR